MNFELLLSEMCAFARSQYGEPYIWSAGGPKGYDCSGFVRAILHVAGLKFSDPQNSQGLFDQLSLRPGTQKVTIPSSGSLVFYGKDINTIDHVAFALNACLVAEAAGGDHTTVYVADAMSRNAFVRPRVYNYRSDLVAILSPKYA